MSVLRQSNPWWSGTRIQDLPRWRRAAYNEIDFWLRHLPAHHALLVSGARQVGKTTLLLQACESLIADGTPPHNILYATFDHPLLKLPGLDKVLKRDMTAQFCVWRVRELEQTVLYLCLHDGGMLDMPDLCKNLEPDLRTS